MMIITEEIEQQMRWLTIGHLIEKGYFSKNK